MENETPAVRTYSEEEYNSLQEQLNEAQTQVTNLEARIAELETDAAETPAEPTSQVVEKDKSTTDVAEPDEITDFCTVSAEASKLFNSLP